MQEIVDQILKGNFELDEGTLEFSDAKLELTIGRGELYEGSFEIFANRAEYVQGTVYSSDLRMECLTQEFSGNSAEIAFLFHGEDMEEGDVVKGAFYVLSNCGEYYLPFVVSVEHFVLDSSIGPIRNLFHFANLAKSDWKEAVNLFYSSAFSRVFEGNDKQFYEDYAGLSSHPYSERNMEEFLIKIRKKQRVEYVVDNQKITVEANPMDGSFVPLEKTIDIVKNGWGYVRLEVKTKGDFLMVEKDILTDDDFLGNHCTLPVYLECSNCGKGNNYGEIELSNEYFNAKIEIVVRVGEEDVLRNVEHSRKKALARLMQLYEAFRMRKMPLDDWLRETDKIVDRLMALDENDNAARLYKAQVLITQERYNEAGFLLDLVGEQENAPEIEAYYLYLTTLIRRDEEYADEIAAEVEKIYQKEAAAWRIAWLLLYLSEDYDRSPITKWRFLEEQFENGCSSLALYIEAVILLNNNPTLLRKLNDFTMQLIAYAARKDMLGAELAEQFLYHVGKVKEYSPVIFHTLERIFAKRKDERVVSEICALLIKGGKIGPKYFEWYERGINAQLRITNLYEYYMMSMDLHEKHQIPKQVLLFFSYRNQLDYERSAYLYDYVLRNRYSQDEIYTGYRPRIEIFVQEQIIKEHINDQLASIYEKCLSVDMVNEENAYALSKLLFANKVRVDDERIRKVILYQPHLVHPKEFILNGKETWVPIYGSERTLLFEDAKGNVYAEETIAHIVEPLMEFEKYLEKISSLVENNVELDLYLLFRNLEGERLKESELFRAIRLSKAQEVDRETRKDLEFMLLRYYFENDKVKALDGLLNLLYEQDYNEKDRAAIIKYMVLRGKYDLAYGWIEKYGPYFVDISTLLRLTAEMISRDQTVENPILLASASYLFQCRKYDGFVLGYLAKFYQGMTKELRNIWNAAKLFEIDRFDLCARMLIQMMYTGAYVGEKTEIFRYYVSQGADQNVENAFVTQAAFDYFVKARLVDGCVFQEIPKLYRRGENISKVCKLAFLKYYAENKEDYREEYKEFMQETLMEMLSQKIYLNAFRELSNFLKTPDEMMDKTVVEYHAKIGNRAKIYYVTLHENGESGEYMSEYMQEAYGGVFFKEFVLFFGETLQYYIMEESEDGEQLTASGDLQKSEIGYTSENSKYHMINDVVVSKTLQDYDTFDDILEEYYRKEFYYSKLFTLR